MPEPLASAATFDDLSGGLLSTLADALHIKGLADQPGSGATPASAAAIGRIVGRLADDLVDLDVILKTCQHPDSVARRAAAAASATDRT